MLRNKHVITALIVTPILAILAYFATGALVGEKPHAARDGGSYPLLAGSDCRYGSLQCTLSNGDFKAILRWTGAALAVETATPVDAVAIGVSNAPDGEAPPQPLRPTSNDGLNWALALGQAPGDTDTLRIALADGATHYYAEVGTAFFEDESMQQ